MQSFSSTEQGWLGREASFQGLVGFSLWLDCIICSEALQFLQTLDIFILKCLSKPRQDFFWAKQAYLGSFLWHRVSRFICFLKRSWPQMGRRQHNRWRKTNQESGQSLVLLFARMVLPALLVFGLTWVVWVSELETKETCDTFIPEHLTAGVKASGELALVAAPSARVPGFLQWADLLFLVCMNYTHAPP